MSTKLGFYDLMNIAEQNAEQTARKAKNQKFASFECPKPKKLDPKQKVLSDNIQKFLAKKKEEERRALEEEKRKKEKLLELRSQDKKATKRVGQMLRMTKSANKSVLAEAKDSLQDSLVEQDGYQPDEDDYGYVSQHAAEYHKKMMEKYRALPKNKPIPTKTPEGVPIPQSQSLKASNSSSAEAPRSSGSVDNRKPKPKRPEPVNFDTLMKLAEVNSKEPPKALVPTPRAREEEKFEFGRPMTKKEKAEYLLEKEVRRKIEQGTFNPTSAPKLLTAKTPTPIKSSRDSKMAAPSPGPSNAFSSRHSVPGATNPNSKPSKGQPIKSNSKQSETIKQASSSAIPKMNGSVSKNPAAPSAGPSSAFHAPPYANGSAKVKKLSEREGRNPIPTRVEPTKTPIPPKHNRLQQPKEQNQRPKPQVPKSATSDLNRGSRHSPPPARPKDTRSKDLDRENRKQAPPAEEHHRFVDPDFSKTSRQKYRHIIESDDEYDSEMDDFIDDSEVDPSTISDLIRSITGYDKRKYKDTSDDECMESNVWQQMKEEQKSLRIGIQEDLEDIRREEEENKRKMMKKRRKK